MDKCYILFLRKGKSMNRREADEEITAIQPQKDILEDMEANLSDFALFLTVMKRRRAYR